VPEYDSETSRRCLTIDPGGGNVIMRMRLDRSIMYRREGQVNGQRTDIKEMLSSTPATLREADVSHACVRHCVSSIHVLSQRLFGGSKTCSEFRRQTKAL
jgi:hypothetical protein